MPMYEQLIDQLRRDTLLSKEAYKLLIENRQACAGYLFENARQVRDSVYGRNVFIRGLIEISNRCKNDCFYCGIRRSNGSVSRYRLYETEILESARKGYALGFRTFVLQGGEDAYYTDEVLCGIIQKIKALCPGCAVTLSLGERSFESYKRLKDAGADRYLLRHETANSAHYGKLHPPHRVTLLPSRRKRSGAPPSSEREAKRASQKLNRYLPSIREMINRNLSLFLSRR